MLQYCLSITWQVLLLKEKVQLASMKFQVFIYHYLLILTRYGDSADNTVEENSSVFFLI